MRNLKKDDGISEAVMSVIIIAAGFIVAILLRNGFKNVATTMRNRENTQTSSYIQSLE